MNPGRDYVSKPTKTDPLMHLYGLCPVVKGVVRLISNKSHQLLSMSQLQACIVRAGLGLSRLPKFLSYGWNALVRDVLYIFSSEYIWGVLLFWQRHCYCFPGKQFGWRWCLRPFVEISLKYKIWPICRRSRNRSATHKSRVKSQELLIFSA